MPCKGPQNHVLEFQECVDMLYEITKTYSTSHIIVFGGDFNEDIINASNNQRSRYILDFMAENYFTTVDVGDIYQLVRFRLFLDRLHYISSFIQRAVNGHCEN